jgi:hypothetical protein
MNDQSAIALLFRIGEHLLAVEALAVRSALLRSSEVVSERAGLSFVRRSGKELVVTPLAPILGVSQSNWSAVLVIGSDESEERAFAVSKCEVVRSVRTLGVLSRKLLQDVASPATHVFSALVGAREELGVFLSTDRLLRHRGMAKA